ncbi:MAG TPA: DUF58 domain-containing protein [Ornithinimicrobium sp.]|uniref:DUF58 domain-containing protein n=1 Tax=Ornithinimicrobium sp. TaxID=1977084 RepID=UPI002B498F5D|nr:DUF58 domain-containing protein [Ornithinimicrobium sp.]HKJ11959.1 DUF58 domain-containing protein [Ornithinimicrobium sp.]
MRFLQVLTPRGVVFLSLGLLTSVSGVLLGYPDLTRIGVALTVLPAMALVLSRRRPPSLAVSRVVSPRRLHPEEPGSVEATFRNVGARRTPLYLAQEHLDVELGDAPRFVLHTLEPGERRTLRYQVRSSRRGAYRLGPLSLRQRDPFGLIYVAVRLSSTTEVLLLPRVYDLTGPGALAQGRGTEGEQPQMVALHGEDDVSIRQYRDGDELRRVHWPATAHRGELMVRQEDRPARRRAVLLLDSRGGAHGRSRGPSDTFEGAVSAVASAGRALIREGYVVHLLSAHTVATGAAGHPMDLSDLLETLARAARDDDLGLETVAAAAHTFTSGGVLAVAAVVDHDAEEMRHLAAIREPGSTAVAFVLERGSFAHDPARARRAESAEAGFEPERPARVLEEAGWSTARCASEADLAPAWMSLHRHPRRAGAGGR